jgi:hypothetical protein
VSIMSSNGMPIRKISDTVDHKSTHVTETVISVTRAPHTCRSLARWCLTSTAVEALPSPW